MELTVEQMLQRGVAAHNAGNLQEAEGLYRAVLQVQPDNPDANHNLGLIVVSMSQPGVALSLFKTALESNPAIELFWFSYINELVKENELETAKNVLAEGKKLGLVGEKVEAIVAQLKEIEESAGFKLSQQKNSLTLSEKRKKTSGNKKKKKKKSQNSRFGRIKKSLSPLPKRAI
jgi:tetratricopeptide (TPR) repeat protein